MLWLHIIQYTGFFFAQITNSIVIFLILAKAGTLFGSYRHLMLTFATYSLVYSWIEIAAQPVMHIKPPCLFMYMNSPLKTSKSVGYAVTCLYTSSFGLVISLLGAQFYYRYVVLCRSEKLKNFDGFKITLLLLPCLICFLVWFQFNYWGMGMTREKMEFMREELEISYGENSSAVPFVAPMYWQVSGNGERIWQIWDIAAAVGCFSLLNMCFSTILYCATKTYWSLKQQQGHLSSKTIELNRQLFITLVFQTLLPFFMMCSPVGIVICLPVLNIYLGKATNFVPACLAIYPALEPIIAMFCIRDFREFICCHNRHNEVASNANSNTLNMLQLP